VLYTRERGEERKIVSSYISPKPTNPDQKSYQKKENPKERGIMFTCGRGKSNICVALAVYIDYKTIHDAS